MCFKRLCGKERLPRASMSFKTETRASGSSFVIRGRSVKLDAVILIQPKSSFGYALSRDLRYTLLQNGFREKLGSRADPVRLFDVSTDN
ncbi:hypothetical protein AAC387_Pa03g1605 [Persea americana]